MAIDHRAELALIQRFDQLVRYLRDHMGWPIDGDDFEELTFDYTAEELGINPENAAKIQEIKRLRPLSARQPWGIFFVKFEPKHLPVVALRRVLSQVAIKKRASANAADRAGWEADDLLFVSNYGQGGSRQISFAHFARPASRQDLPTLKVLGWDHQDTPLHLDAVARELTENLAWPQDDNNVDEWRRRWRSAFTLGHREVITTAERLSIRLAELAGAIRDRIRAAMAIESPRGPLTKLMKAFQESLLHDLDAEGFADMYAQTISYGLLSSRIADPTRKTADDFAAHMRTSPFLRELMQTFLKVGGRQGKADGAGIDFDELGVSDVVELLDEAKMEAVLRDFGDRNRQEDPVIHFFEGFLQAYDKRIRKDRGVFYTPQPVVSYIVRSVHELLQTEFGLEDGLADTTTWGEMLKRRPGLKLPPLTDAPNEERTISPDEPFVQILDPATGTATFLVEVIDVIHRTLNEKWKQQRLTDVQQRAAWNVYVPQHLLPRLHAFELMMAPYAIAHMKIGLKLAETGYRFDSEERARIYLTNALEPWVKQPPLTGFEALAHEAAAVNEVKRHKRFTVVIGNPPYSGHSSNNSDYATGLVYPYHFVDGAPLGERNPKWLQDDYVKFMRFAELLLGHCSVGILGYVTNHSYCDNPTFRGMRRSLMRSFTGIRFLDLHGNSKKKEKSPGGGADENVFDIQQGVAVFLGYVGDLKGESIFHADLWGTRSAKYSQLAKSSFASTTFAQLKPTSPFYLFIPQDTGLRSEFEPLPSVTEVFPAHNMGVTTGDDCKFVAFLEREFEERLRSPAKIRKFSYRPFDTRFLHYDAEKLARARFDFMRHMVEHRNVAMITIRRPRNDKVANFFVSDGLTDKCFISSLDNCQVLPLYLLPDRGKLSFSKEAAPNLAPTFLKRLAFVLNLPQKEPHGLPAGLTPEDILHYAYAVFHSPGYRSRYAEFLKIDFPRLPLTGRLELFRALARLGGQLTALHLLESPRLAQPITEVIGSRTPEVEKVSWSHDTVWVDKAQTTGFQGVREDVWNFHVGGYQVCEKWLKDRKGRTLSHDDIAHYQKVVVALSETICLMAEIDEVIEKYGGWPGAFQSNSQ
jgi:predicted helicase